MTKSTKERITISLTPQALKELEELAKERGMTKSVVITLALEEYKRKGKNENKKERPLPKSARLLF